MKHIFILFAFVCNLFLYSCQCSYCGNVNCEASCCDSCNELSALLYEQFYFTNDSSYLDSSLMVIDRALQECSDSNFHLILSMRKLSILSQKCEYGRAVSCIDSIGLKDKLSQYPYLQSIYHKRFLAMQYHKNEDYISQDSCLKLIVDELDTYISDNKESIDSLLGERDASSMEKSRFDLPMKQYFYYLTILKGKQEIDLVVDSLRQIGTYNFDYLEILRNIYDNDFMVFSGL